MTVTIATHLADYITLPQATLAAVVGTNTTAQSINLATVGNQTQNTASLANQTTGLAGHYVSIQADGGDVYIVAGPTQASVTTTNAPVIATNGTNAAGICFKIPNNQTFHFLPRHGVDDWLGYISAGNAQMRIFQSSY